uniref:Leucine-rich repeat-containing N-terminal plant-type domain-containing protein n=1 Tax=Salix viminalis TaxID=40686 RepID=A0A6N2LTH9_SALVM
MSFSRLLFASLIAFGLAARAFGAAVLPADEVKALRDIAKTLGKTAWNFSADPCGGQWGWANPNAVPDFSQNYLNGSIPPEWGATQMTTISIIGNRFTGPIPKEIGNISTLVNFIVEFNQFSGVLPPELGNLSRLEKLILFLPHKLKGTYTKMIQIQPDYQDSTREVTGQLVPLVTEEIESFTGTRDREHKVDCCIFNCDYEMLQSAVNVAWILLFTAWVFIAA